MVDRIERFTWGNEPTTPNKYEWSYKASNREDGSGWLITFTERTTGLKIRLRQLFYDKGKLDLILSFLDRSESVSF